MAQLGLFRAIARIYTNTPEAQAILQQLRKLFQDAEEKNAVSQEDVVWSEFSEDVHRVSSEVGIQLSVQMADFSDQWHFKKNRSTSQWLLRPDVRQC